MTYNIFTRPTEAFRTEIEDPSIFKAIIFVLVASFFLSVAAMMIGQSINVVGSIILVNIVQWLVLSIVLWFFQIIFSNKKGRMKVISFKEVLSITGKLWVLFIATGILFIIGLILVKTLLALLVVLLMFLLGIILVVASYKMVKVALDIDTKKAIIPWILIIIIYILLLSLLINLANLTIPVI